MTGPVGCCTGTLHRLFAKISSMAAKRTLINRAVRITVEWHTKVFKLVYDLGCLPTHEFDSILIAQIVRTFDGIEHVPVPIIFRHVAKRRTDTALCRNSM